jgi:hypothetical protein
MERCWLSRLFSVCCFWSSPHLRADLPLHRSRRTKEEGFDYVYVNGDGSARELTEDEKEYLNTRFEGSDGNRPSVKFRYESLTPDGRIIGYLLRRQLPAVIKISPAPEVDPNDFR